MVNPRAGTANLKAGTASPSTADTANRREASRVTADRLRLVEDIRDREVMVDIHREDHLRVDTAVTTAKPYHCQNFLEYRLAV